MSFLADRSAVSIGLGGIPSLRSGTGTGGLNPSLPSLDLNFAVSKSLDPRITFTRASEARYYDASTVALAEQNLLLRSQDYSATWTVTDLTPVTAKTAPDATLTATEFTAGAANATLTQAVTAAAGDHTFSVWLRRVTGTGNVDITAHSGDTWVTQTLTTSWARYTVTQTLTAGSRTPGIRVVTSGDVIEVWGAQLEQRSSVTAYTPTTTAAITNYVPVLQTAANGVARFDHNPVTRESLGLLIEEQRTNLLKYSEQFDNAAWVKNNVTVTPNAAVSPGGAQNASELSKTGTTGYLHRTYIGATVGSAYTYSVYVKKGTLNWVSLRTVAGLIDDYYYFDLVNGVVGVNAGGKAQIQSVGGGWYRCVVSDVATGTSVGVRISGANGDELQNTTGSVFIWGAQLEAGAFATSYIPTVASQVTRSADAASMTGSNFSSWYRADEGTVYAEAESSRVTVNLAGIYSLSDNTSANRIESYASAANHLYVVAGGALQADLDGGAFSTNVFTKLAAVYKVNDMAVVLNSGVVAADTSAVVPSVNKLWVGANYDGATALNGHIKKLAYYPVRLANATLQSLTA